MRVAIALLLGAGFLASCASISPEQCRAGDWRGIGISDGENGRSESYVSRHQDACGKVGIVPDVAAWNAGREIGLERYCTPQNAYRIGRDGTELSNQCTGPSVSELNAANIKGRKYHAINREISNLRTRSNDIDTRLFMMGPQREEDGKREQRELRRERSRIEARISDLEIERIGYSAL